MSDDIKWNKDKHDDENRERDKKQLQDKLKRLFGEWKRALCASKRTREEIITSVEQLKLEFQQLVETSGPLIDPEYIKFTTELLDQQTAKILAETFVTKNSITEYIPLYVNMDGTDPKEETLIFSGDKKKPRKYSFKNASEFYGIPFVRQMAGSPGFICFVRDGQWVRGVFRDGEVVALGKLANMMGVENMITQEQFQSEVKKLPTQPEPTDPPPPTPTESGDPTAPGPGPGPSDSFAA